MTSYEILEVSRNASKEEIKSAYRRLSMRYHPDMSGGDSGKFIQVKEAYEALMKQKDSPVVEVDSSIVVTAHMYDSKKNTMDLHITHSSNFVYATGYFGDKSATWSMLGRTQSVLHISKEYMRPSFEMKFVTKDLTAYTKEFNFDIPKKRKPDVKVKVDAKSSSNSCLGCIVQVVILFIIIQLIKKIFNLN
jgi:hypothetical protein